MRTNKRSQMEAFGLAVIVILITIGFFVYISLKRNDVKDDPKKSYIIDEMASNFVNSIISVNVKECADQGYTVSDLIRGCSRGDNIYCQGISACELANSTISEILNKTLIAQYYSFHLYTEGLNWNINNQLTEINITNRACTKRDPQGQTGSVPLTKYPVPGEVHLNLEICRK